MSAHTARAHAKLSPSAAHRWINCPGSPRECAGIPNKSSIFADEGTAAHTLGELCLRDNVEPVDFLGGHVNIKIGSVYREPGDGDGVFEVDDEMVDAVGLYVQTVRDLIEPGDEVEYEAKLDLRHIPGMEFGTGDCVIYKPTKRRLVIVDLKYGRGTPVEAEDNPQTRTYALGAAQRFHNRGVDWVESIIVQPRCPHPEGSVRREVIEGIDLVEFRIELEQAAAATAKPDAPLHAGEWCKFCPAAPTCKALMAKVQSVAEMEFGVDEAPPLVASMDPDTIALVLHDASVVKGWMKAVEERAHQMARDGNPPTGFKLVSSRATRRWKDEDATAKYLVAVVDVAEDQVYGEPKIKSPAQIEKLIGAKRKGEITDLYTSKASGTILVPIKDPRPPVKADAEEEFADAEV